MIKINTTQYDRMPGSTINRDWYQNRLTGQVIFQEFDEANEQYSFYLVWSGVKYSLGESYTGFEDEMLLTIYSHPSVSLNNNRIVIKK